MDLGGFPQQAAVWLASLDKDTLRKARAVQIEAIVDAAIALSGLFLLGWPPQAMLLFMIFSLWLRFFQMFGAWLFDRDRVEEVMRENDAVEEARSLVRHVRDGMPERESPGLNLHPALERPGVQLAVTFYFVGAFTASLVYQLASTVGLSLGALLLDRPDMLLLMGGIASLRIYAALQRVREPRDRAPWLGTITPMLEIVLFPMLVAFWMIVSAIGVRVADMLGADPQYVSAAVFVCGGYALVVWRAVIELRDLPVLTRDLSWLADRA